MPHTSAPDRAALESLAPDYWVWRPLAQPRTDDDIPRLERPRGWRPDWSADAVAGYREAVAEFERRWAALPLPDPASEDPAVRAYVVDHALIGSAIARARFELDVERLWQTDPAFYVDQSIGVAFDLIRPGGEFDEERTADIIAALRNIGPELAQGRENVSGYAVEEPTRLLGCAPTCSPPRRRPRPRWTTTGPGWRRTCWALTAPRRRGAPSAVLSSSDSSGRSPSTRQLRTSFCIRVFLSSPGPRGSASSSRAGTGSPPGARSRASRCRRASRPSASASTPRRHSCGASTRSTTCSPRRIPCATTTCARCRRTSSPCSGSA